MSSTKKTITAGGVVLNSKGHVLVVSQGGASWSLPKGHVDPGEELLDAAQREIYEESGINQLKFIEKLGCYQRYRMGKDPRYEDISELKELHFFLFTTVQNDLAPIDPHNPEARWVEKEAVSALLTHPKDKEFFKSIINKLS